MTAHAVAVEILRRRGMNLDEIPKPSTPRFDLIEWRQEQARQILDGLVPAKFTDAQPDRMVHRALQRADAALYEAKAAGRDAVRVHGGPPPEPGVKPPERRRRA